MGLLDFLLKLLTGTQKVQCPSCGAEGAERTKDERILCRNPQCPNFDASRVRGKMRHGSTAIPTSGNYRPEHPVDIKYRNFLGEERTFSAEQSSLVRKNNHLVARVAPTGRRISLSRDRIENLSEIESGMAQRVASGQAWPSPRERQILNYHKKHGTTSARFEEVRRKYPNW